MRLCLLECGIIVADRSVICPGDDSRLKVRLPVVSVLVETEGRRVLIDTGLPVIAADDGRALQRAFDIDPAWILPLMSRRNRVDHQLAALGVRIMDLDLVVNTHFHFDHAGGNELFGGVTIAAQTEELTAARESEDYAPVWDAPNLQFRPVNGDWSPAPGLEMLFTPGHTPGHQSMLVRLPAETWLFTWDAVYTEEHWRSRSLGATQDAAAARESVKRLRDIAKRERAKIVFGHDLAQLESLGLTDQGEPIVLAES